MTTIDRTDRDGRTALHMAAFANDASRTRELILAGAAIDLPDNAGMTPLHLAAQELSLDAARALIEAGASVNAVNAHGNSPLFVAVFNSRGRGDMIQLLRRHDADPDAVNAHGQTPRGLADLIGNYDVAQFFAD